MTDITDFVLKQTTEKKIQLLEDAYDANFGTFWALADIFLKAPCGKGGGLSTELIDVVALPTVELLTMKKSPVDIPLIVTAVPVILESLRSDVRGICKSNIN